MKFTAFERSLQGTGASRRLRNAGKVPGIVYGVKEPAQIELDHNALYHALKKEAFHSSVLEMELGGETTKVVLRDLQMHPYKPLVLHVDFQRVDSTTRIHKRVPLHFINEASAKGVKQQGGVVSHALIDLEIACLPKDLPEFIEIDLANLGMGEALHLSGIPLPAGVELADKVAPGSDQDTIVVSIHHPHVGEESSVVAPTTPAA